jgi:serine/threonine protein phosphatase PrpC
VISLEKHPSLTTDPSAALTETFVKTNTALMVTPMNYMTSGCTCVAVYIKGRTLYVANSGDSRAVMAVDSGKTLDKISSILDVIKMLEMIG